MFPTHPQPTPHSYHTKSPQPSNCATTTVMTQSTSWHKPTPNDHAHTEPVKAPENAPTAPSPGNHAEPPQRSPATPATAKPPANHASTQNAPESEKPCEHAEPDSKPPESFFTHTPPDSFFFSRTHTTPNPTTTNPMTTTEHLDVGRQHPTADHNRCWGDLCYTHRGPQRPIHNQTLGLCHECHNDIIGQPHPTPHPTHPPT